MIDHLEKKISTKMVLLLMLIAYVFSFLIRMIWVWQMGDNPNFIWHNQLMINTNDGYYFASSAQRYLEDMHQFNPRVPELFRHATVALTVLLVKITPFSLETVILYLPALVASIVVVPMILIGRLYKWTVVGFLAALIGSVAWSYYNRTMTGYYDTDMFAAMAPMFIVYFLLRTIEKEDMKSAMMAAAMFLIYPFLYDAGRALIYTIGIIYLIYMIIFHRKETFTYQSITVIFLAMLPLGFLLKLLLLIVTYLLFSRWEIKRVYLYLAAGIMVLIFLATSGFAGLIVAKLLSYAERGVDLKGLHFYQVNQTVSEAGRISFERMSNRIIGSQITLLLSLAGYIFLVLRHRAFLVTLPLIGIGIFSLWGGLRFTVYAVPVAALSVMYFFYFVAGFISDAKARAALLVAATIGVLYPNITHIIAYKVPTVFNKQEVESLEKLRSMGSSKDYVLTWWDYGYPIWFYSNKNTLIDGGKHNHDNYLISKILTTSSPLLAARLSRIAVETYVDSNYSVVADKLFKNGKKDQRDPNDYLDELELSTAVSLPKKSREIYLYLPQRMIGIYPVVKRFSSIDLSSGIKQRLQPVRVLPYQDRGDRILLGGGAFFSKVDGRLHTKEGQSYPLKAFHETTYDKAMQFHKKSHYLDMRGDMHLIIERSMGRALLISDEDFRSIYIQMYVMQNYDADLFEPVVMTPWSKIYRVKL